MTACTGPRSRIPNVPAAPTTPVPSPGRLPRSDQRKSAPRSAPRHAVMLGSAGRGRRKEAEMDSDSTILHAARAGISEVSERLTALVASLPDATAPILPGTWTVREASAHLALET